MPGIGDAKVAWVRSPRFVLPFIVCDVGGVHEAGLSQANGYPSPGVQGADRPQKSQSEIATFRGSYQVCRREGSTHQNPTPVVLE